MNTTCNEEMIRGRFDGKQNEDISMTFCGSDYQ